MTNPPTAILSILAFMAAAGLLTITPGVDTALVLRNATSSGVRGGAGAALGVCLGLLVWGVGAAFGIAALLAASSLAFNLLKAAGAAYLIFLGVKLLWKPRSAMATVPVRRGDDQPQAVVIAAFSKGLLTNLLNPKVGVFYVTFLPQFIPTGAPVAAFSLLLAGIHVLLTLAWFALLIALTVPLGRFLSRPKVMKSLDRLTGCVFVGFGVRLAMIDHPS